MNKQLIATLDERLAHLHARSSSFVRLVPAEYLYRQPRASAGAFPVYSCGEHILRSAATIEQTCGGINVNLWDDPFEWTLPEALTTTGHIVEYLDEVEATRRRAFDSFRADEDLLKRIALPSGEMQTLLALLLETLVRAAHHQGCAFATFRLFSDERLPRF